MDERAERGLRPVSLIISTLVPSIALAIAISWLLDMEIWEEVLLSSLSGLLAASLIALFLIGDRYEIRIPSPLIRIVTMYKKELLAILYLTSILCVVLIPPTGPEEIYMAWQALPAASWLRLVASLALAGLFPGVIFIQLVLKPGKRSLVEKLVASYFFSLVFYVLLYELCLALGLERPSGLTALLIIANSLLLGAFITDIALERRHQRAEESESTGEGGESPSLSSARLLEALVLVSVSILVIAGAAIIAAHYSPLVRGDMWTVHGHSRRFYMAELGKGDFTADHQWYMYIACCFALSGIPTANAFTALLAFGPIIYLAFYLMAKAAFKKSEPKLPLLAVVFALMAGYGWAYFLYLRGFQGLDVEIALEKATSITYDIWYPFLMFPRIVTRKFHAAIPGLFLLCYLMLERDTPRKLKYSLMAVTAAICFVFHVFEELLFLLIFTTYNFIKWIRGELDLAIFKNDCLALFAGGLLSIGLDLASPSPCHLIPALTAIGAVIASVIWPIALIPLAYLLQRARPYLVSKLKSFKVPKAPRWSKLLMAFFVLYAYVLSFMIVFGGYGPYFELFTLVPLYYYPIKLGLVGTLALIYIFLPRGERQQGRGDFFLAFLISYSMTIIGIRAWFALIEPGFFFAEFRCFVFSFAPICLASAIGGKGALERLKTPAQKGWPYLMGGLISTLLFVGLASNILSIEAWAIKGLSWPEETLEAASYIASELRPEQSVLALSPFSWEILALSGVRLSQITPGLYDGYRAFILAEKPGTYLALLSEGCVTYAFMTGADAYFASGSFIMGMLPYLEPVMEVPGAEVLKIPPLSGPRAETNTVLLRQTPLLVLSEDFDEYADGEVPQGWESEGDCGIRDGELRLRGNATCTINNIRLPAFKLMVKANFLGLYSPVARARIYFGRAGPRDFYSIDIYTDRIVLTRCSNGVEEELYEEPTFIALGTPFFLTIEVLGLSTIISIDNMYAAEVRLPEIPDGLLALGSENCHMAFDDIELYQLFPDELSYESTIFMLALTGLSYTVLTDLDPRAHDAEVLVMTDGLYDDIGPLLQLVEEGTKLVVLDGVGLGFIAANLSISYTDEVISVDGVLVGGELREIPELSIRAISCEDADVEIVAYFASGGTPVAPYALKKEVGLGEVLYLHVQDYLRELLSSGETKWALFNGLEALGAVLPGVGEFRKQASFPDIIEGLVEFRGDVRLYMRSFLAGEKASFSAVDVLIEPQGLSADDVNIHIMEIKGDVHIEAHFPSIKLSGQRGLPCSYSFVIAQEGGELILTASGDGMIVAEIEGLGRIDLQEATLRISSDRSMTLYASALHILANGQTSFEKVWCHRDGAPFVLKGTPADVEGTVKLSVGAADTHMLVLDELELRGDIRLRPERPVSLFPLLDVKWDDLLLSDKNLIALAIAYSFIAVWLIKKFLYE